MPACRPRPATVSGASVRELRLPTRQLGMLLALLLSLCLAACAGKTEISQSPQTADNTVPAASAATAGHTISGAADAAVGEKDNGPCLEAWTYAPGNFVLDVAEGADVFLVPEVQDFPLFCSATQAREALHKGIAQGELPDANGGWAIYRVEGVFHDIARAVGYGNYILKREARLTDWSY